MNRLRSLVSSRSDSTNSTPDTGGAYVKAKTGGLTSPSCILINQTNATLYLRDKVGAAYGGTRYVIPANGQIEVAPLQHTFFKMIPYAVAVEEAGSTDNKEENQSTDNKEKNQSTEKKDTKKITDTKLTIDSDQLTDCKKITIKFSGEKYEVEYDSR